MDGIEKLQTFLNESNYPILRRCFNCKHWMVDGGCSLMIVKDTESNRRDFVETKEYYMCFAHRFKNEERLNAIAKKVNLKSSLKSKEDLHITRF